MNIPKINTALNRTWQAIGSDVLSCSEEDDMPKEEVIETVLDADFLHMYGGLTSEEYAEFKALSYSQRLAIARNAFTYDYYGN